MKKIEYIINDLTVRTEKLPSFEYDRGGILDAVIFEGREVNYVTLYLTIDGEVGSTKEVHDKINALLNQKDKEFSILEESI